MSLYVPIRIYFMHAYILLYMILYVCLGMDKCESHIYIGSLHAKGGIDEMHRHCHCHYPK